MALSIHWPQAIGWLWARNEGNQANLACLEQKARELAASAKNKKKAETEWEVFLKESHLEQDWAMESEFRSFLSTGEALADYRGCRLW